MIIQVQLFVLDPKTLNGLIKNRGIKPFKPTYCFWLKNLKLVKPNKSNHYQTMRLDEIYQLNISFIGLG
jgi:hypothetical protein